MGFLGIFQGFPAFFHGFSMVFPTFAGRPRRFSPRSPKEVLNEAMAPRKATVLRRMSSTAQVAGGAKIWPWSSEMAIITTIMIIIYPVELLIPSPVHTKQPHSMISQWNV